MHLAHIFLFCLATTFPMFADSLHKVHSRSKRYIVFPTSSEFSIQFCMSTYTLTDNDIYTGGMNFQISYELPNETIRGNGYNNLLFGEPRPVEKRRDRRDVYSKMEIIFNSVGIDGRECMLRTLCETTQRLVPRKSLLTELFRIIFTLPLELVREHEPADLHEYDMAHRHGLAELDCIARFPKCPMSFLDMAFR